MKLARPYKNHNAGEVLDVSDGIRDELRALGLLEEEPKEARSEGRTKKVSRPVRDKMISSPARSKRMAGEGEAKKG